MTLTDGRVCALRQSAIKGSRDFPLPRAELLAKFHDCLNYGIRPYSTAQLEALVQAVDGMDGLADVMGLMILL